MTSGLMLQLQLLLLLLSAVLMAVLGAEYGDQGTCMRLRNTTTLTRRQEIRSLSAPQLQELRDRFSAAIASGIFPAVAADHGVPNYYCSHSEMRFLPWRKAMSSETRRG